MNVWRKCGRQRELASQHQGITENRCVCKGADKRSNVSADLKVCTASRGNNEENNKRKTVHVRGQAIRLPAQPARPIQGKVEKPVFSKLPGH